MRWSATASGTSSGRSWLMVRTMGSPDTMIVPRPRTKSERERQMETYYRGGEREREMETLRGSTQHAKFWVEVNRQSSKERERERENQKKRAEKAK